MWDRRSGRQMQHLPMRFTVRFWTLSISAQRSWQYLMRHRTSCRTSVHHFLRLLPCMPCSIRLLYRITALKTFLSWWKISDWIPIRQCCRCWAIWYRSVKKPDTAWTRLLPIRPTAVSLNRSLMRRRSAVMRRICGMMCMRTTDKSAVHGSCCSPARKVNSVPV